MGRKGSMEVQDELPPLMQRKNSRRGSKKVQDEVPPLMQRKNSRRGSRRGSRGFYQLSRSGSMVSHLAKVEKAEQMRRDAQIRREKIQLAEKKKKEELRRQW